MASEDREKRKVHRSPSYPVFDLAEAIQKADAVYKGEKRSATTPDVVASHLGYSQAKGPGGRAVSALRQFGLLEDNNGKCRISDLGYTLIQYDRDSQEWKTAAAEAAKLPTLFRELADEYSGELPSDAALRNDLLRKGFNPAAISDVVSIFRSTMSLAGQEGSLYDRAGEGSPMRTVVERAEVNDFAAVGSVVVQRPRTMAEAQQAAGVAPIRNEVRQDVFSLTEGPVTIQWPATLSAESFQDLGDWLDIVKRKIGRSVKTGEPVNFGDPAMYTDKG
jgi:hypothetical protein